MLDMANELKGTAAGFGGGAGTAAGFGGGGGGFVAFKHAACPFGLGFGGRGRGGVAFAILLRRGMGTAPGEELGTSPPSLSEPERSALRREGGLEESRKISLRDDPRRGRTRPPPCHFLSFFTYCA